MDSRVFGTKTVDNPVDIVESLGDSGCMVYAYMAMEIKYLFPDSSVEPQIVVNGDNCLFIHQWQKYLLGVLPISCNPLPFSSVSNGYL